MSDSRPSLAAPSPRRWSASTWGLLAPDGRRARARVEQGLAAGVPAAILYLRVIAPATPFGAQMVGEFLEAQRWSVLALGANIPVGELVELVRAREAQLVALSTALTGYLRR